MIIWLRDGELWIGKWGFFWKTLYGFEPPSGKFYGWASK